MKIEKIRIKRIEQEDISAPMILAPETPIDYSLNPDVSIEGEFFIVKYNENVPIRKKIAMFIIRLLKKL